MTSFTVRTIKSEVGPKGLRALVDFIENQPWLFEMSSVYVMQMHDDAIRIEAPFGLLPFLFL